MSSRSMLASSIGPIELPPRAARAQALRALLGEPRPSARRMSHAIRIPALHAYDRAVVPLIRRHWPALMHDRFGKKLRFLACDLYACAPYTVLFCAPNRPPMIRAMTVAASSIESEAAIGRIAELAMSLLARLGDAHRRVVQAAAFIATIDHAFDHTMDEPFPERGRRLHELLAGAEAKESAGALALSRALLDALSDLPPEDLPAWRQTVREVNEWIDAEVAAMHGVEDATGLCHRAAGVKGTIDGVVFPLRRYVSPAARTWLYDVSMFVQMMDDWIDCDLDREIERVTPVITGRWSFGEISSAWRKTVEDLEALTRAGGLSRPSYLRFVRDVYSSMMVEVMNAMIDGIAD